MWARCLGQEARLTQHPDILVVLVLDKLDYDLLLWLQLQQLQQQAHELRRSSLHMHSRGLRSSIISKEWSYTSW